MSAMSEKSKETSPNTVRYELLSNKEIVDVNKELIIKYVKKLPPNSGITSQIMSELFLSIYMTTKYEFLYKNGIECEFRYGFYVKEKIHNLVSLLTYDLNQLKPELRSKLRKIKISIKNDNKYCHTFGLGRSSLVKLAIYFDSYEVFLITFFDSLNVNMLLLTINCCRDNMFKTIFDAYIRQNSIKGLLLNLVNINEKQRIVLLPTLKRLGYFEGNLNNNSFLRLLFKDEFFKQIVSLDLYEYVVDLYYDKDSGPGYKKWQKEMNNQYTQIEKVIAEPKLW